ncbi:MAG: STAS domain-containing protein [Ignavibacteriaceae bacterium]
MNKYEEFENKGFFIDMIDGIFIIKFSTMRVTLNEAKALKQVLDSLVTANHYKLVIDFSETRFFDSAIANVLINVVKEIRKSNGDIITITPHSSINKLFIQTRLSKIFKQYNNVEQALLGFSGA